MPTRGKRRALGQHFLRDESIARLIADTAVDEAVKAGCVSLLEIGPGQGAITLPIFEALRRQSQIRGFTIVEKDQKLAGRWIADAPNHASAELRVKIHPGDFLELPENYWLKSTPLAVASNLPYSTGTAITTRLARHLDAIPVMVLMFQAEVARRLRAEPSTKEWGSLSLWIQNRWDVRKLAFVPPGAFQPPPEVDSEVVVLTRREKSRISFPETPVVENLWEKLLQVGFAHRRKMLRSGLPATGIWRNALELSGIDGTKRSEALNWNEWQKLMDAALHLSAFERGENASSTIIQSSQKGSQEDSQD